MSSSCGTNRRPGQSRGLRRSFARRSKSSTASVHCWKSASAVLFRATNTRSHAPSTVARRCRTASRSRLRIRFRTTELPTRRPAMKAQRWFASEEGKAYRTSSRFAQDFPSRNTRWISSPRRNRRARFMFASFVRHAHTHRFEIVTVSLLRPFRLRAFSTLRPPDVLIRARKP